MMIYTTAAKVCYLRVEASNDVKKMKSFSIVTTPVDIFSSTLTGCSSLRTNVTHQTSNKSSDS